MSEKDCNTVSSGLPYEKNGFKHKTNVLKLTYSALFISLALMLPFFTGQIKVLGKMLNLMHVPVFLCGLSCGGIYGLAVGFIAPLLRSITFGMPVLYPNAVAMAFELGAYGLLSGLIYKKLYGKKLAVYISLAVSMLLGRIVWWFASLLFWSFAGEFFTFAMFIKGAFVDSSVGIALHLLIIPPIVQILKKTNLLLIKGQKKE